MRGQNLEDTRRKTATCSRYGGLVYSLEWVLPCLNLVSPTRESWMASRVKGQSMFCSFALLREVQKSFMQGCCEHCQECNKIQSAKPFAGPEGILISHLSSCRKLERVLKLTVHPYTFNGAAYNNRRCQGVRVRGS